MMGGVWGGSEKGPHGNPTAACTMPHNVMNGALLLLLILLLLIQGNEII